MNTKDIFACTDHREFLQSYLKSRKASQGLRALARKAGFKSSGHLAMVVRGERRLTLRSAELLASALALKGRRKSLLLAFSRFDTSKGASEKNAAFEEILRLKGTSPEFELTRKQYSFLAVWYYPILYTLLQNNPDDFAPEYLAARLGRGVTSAQVEEGLRDLESLGLLEKTERGWSATSRALGTPDDVRDIAVSKYHRNSLELATGALSLPLDAREFNGLTVAVPVALLPKVKEKLRALRSELNELLSNETTPADVYQINFQLFPVTAGVEKGKR